MSPKIFGVEMGDEQSERPLTPLERAQRASTSFDVRLTRTEGLVDKLSLEVATLTELVANAKAFLRGIVSRGILLILGAVGGTYGVTRASETHPEAQQTVVTKSATTVKVEACTAMQPGPDRDQCAIRILTELMGPQR